MAYSAKERSRILTKYKKLVAKGDTVVKAAKACGVSYLTINRWLKSGGKKPTAKKRGGRAKASGRRTSRQSRAARLKFPA